MPKFYFTRKNQIFLFDYLLFVFLLIHSAVAKHKNFIGVTKNLFFVGDCEIITACYYTQYALWRNVLFYM